jgi:YegS/Rv2252/BmrU family lipid kinase
MFAEAGIRAMITLAHDGDELHSALATAVENGVSAVIAGGGDGTVNTVANAIVGHDIALGVLPLGTLNHFARDIGVPTDMAEAARVIIAGHTMDVDVGEVNGRCFLNNSSVGLYPRIVQLRERYRARGLEKWIVAAWATWRVTRVQRPLRMQIEVQGRDVVRSTPLIFIGNNPYRMAGFDAGSRESLTGGQLALYVVADAGRWNLIRLVWRILVGTAQESGALEMATARTAQVDLPFDRAVTSVSVAIDGEVTTMDLPLRYAIRAGALSVIVPAPT